MQKARGLLAEREQRRKDRAVVCGVLLRKRISFCPCRGAAGTSPLIPSEDMALYTKSILCQEMKRC